jgi:FKBP-type peptidyl-prolyl cis-trans isomerase FklB
MKNIKFILAVLLVVAFTACNSNKAKLPTLKTDIDSLNYAFGLANGNGIKNYYLAKDSANSDSLKIKIASLLKGIKDGMKGDDSNYGELEGIGTNIGSALKEQSVKGLMGDSTLKVDMDLIKQGLVNGLRGSKLTMTAEEAQMYVNSTMQRLQQAKMASQQ